MRYLAQWLPILSWGKDYNRSCFSQDLMAAVIVTIMLIPQSLAYALLAGLPPQIGLYASILPLMAYAIFGTSKTLAVGPVAVISLMTAAAIAALGPLSESDQIIAAMVLALLSGLFLVLLGVFRLGFLANFLSHPVISGFISASGLLIAASQLKHILGIQASGHNLLELLHSLFAGLGNINVATLALGVFALVFLFWARRGVKPVLRRLGMGEYSAAMVAKAGPVFAVVATTLITALLGLAEPQNGKAGVAIVGAIPTGLPALSVPSFDFELWAQLIGAAILMSIIGFVESVSVAQTLAAKRRQRIEPNQELVALGAANIASACSGGYPVTGGFARSAVNYDAGAQTPAAGAYTAIGIALATLFLTPFLYYLPRATLAATIIVAVLSLVDIHALKRIWAYSKRDAAAMLATFFVTLAVNIEMGILAGVGLSLILWLYKTSQPHCAIVGLVPGSEHFRNIDRHKVICSDKMKTLRVDESLYFANARFLEEKVNQLVAEYRGVSDLVLMCPAVNTIDASALESLERINHLLQEGGVRLHLSEVKGPVMDRLKQSDFLSELSGQVFLSQYDALCALDPELIKASDASSNARDEN